MFLLEPTSATRNGSSSISCGCDRCLVAKATSRVPPLMARPTKTQQFTIGEDGGIPPSPNSTQPPKADKTSLSRNDDAYSRHQQQIHGGSGRSSAVDAVDEDEDDHEGEEDDVFDSSLLHHQFDDADADDERRRRESALTSTSVSSLPGSALETDDDRHALHMHTPYTPPMIRPSFRRPESVKKMQMSSPAPSERNLRRSVLSPPRPRTPRSARVSVKSSARRQKWVEGDEEAANKEYPLVLLHLTLMPVELRWSRRSMEDVLPASTLEALQLLQSKVSKTIIQRGILIPHPREDYELLEERLLEALELKKERISRGHFRTRNSTSSADSGVGSSVEDVENDNCCETCHAKNMDYAVHAGGRKWSIKIFAANGLMRESAWTAAWPEMERVDVEILPWIDEDLRRTLDTRALQDAADERERQEQEAVRISEAEEQFRLLQQERARARNVHQTAHADHHTSNDEAALRDTEVLADQADDLPRVYQPKDIPLSLLLKNYIYLLAQDKRNIAIFGLAVLALVLSLRASLLPGLDVPPLPPVCETIQTLPPVHEQRSMLSRAGSIHTAETFSTQDGTREQDVATATIGQQITGVVARDPAIASPQFPQYIDQKIAHKGSLEKNFAQPQEAEFETQFETEFSEAAQCPNVAYLSLIFEGNDQCTL